MEEEGNAYVAMEKEGAISEKMRRLKQTRGGAKAEFTRRENELKELLRDNDVTAVRRASDGLSTAMDRFRLSHFEFMRLLVEEPEKEESQSYLDEVEKKFPLMQEEVKTYLEHAGAAQGVGAKAASEIACSVTSSRRTTSSMGSSRAKAAAAAKKAILLAEASTLKAQQKLDEDEMELRRRRDKGEKELVRRREDEERQFQQRREEEEMQLRQRRETLRLETEISKAAAEEEAWANAEREEDPTNVHPSDRGVLDVSGTSLTRERLSEKAVGLTSVHLAEQRGPEPKSTLLNKEKHAFIVSWADNVEAGASPEAAGMQRSPPQMSKLNPHAEEWEERRDNRSMVVEEGASESRTLNEEFMRTMSRDMMQLPTAELMTFDGDR
ncbi:PREDICTED: inner centromere protein-like [Priapulus caudatus]|uniref:Inner centromere protein-like n=1 Tax=Priapulus caudatus TaxID=37621 RepID=A0ABM1EC27_PRICU|nr:PREDICTED: inner centromere protein-like [Priapulus caudatus]